MNIHNFLGRPVFFRTRCSPHGLEHGFRRLEDIDDALNAQPPQLTFPVVGTDAARLKKGVVHLEVSYRGTLKSSILVEFSTLYTNHRGTNYKNG